MKRWLFILGIYALYLAGVKQMIVLFQRTGIIAIQGSIPDDAIIKWASILLLSLIIAMDSAISSFRLSDHISLTGMINSAHD